MGFSSKDMLGKTGDLHHRMKYNFGGHPDDFEAVFGAVFHGIDAGAISSEELEQILEFFKMNGRERLFYLVDSYINEKFNSYTFESIFHVLYRDEWGTDLSKEERELMGHIFDIGSRFSPNEEDHKNYPGMYYTEQELRAVADKVYRTLIDK
ncbi:MAG: hypothetical protein FWE20_01725 [Defluviitaleaceae bacterium]|nr:hypothetical protein [Defluviitaleaceae bacterium]